MAQRSIEWEQLDLWRYYTIGPSLWVANRFILYPPSLIKTRLHLQPVGVSQYYDSTVDCLKKIIRKEGVSALWKGFGTSLLGIFGSQTYITMYKAESVLK